MDLSMNFLSELILLYGTYVIQPDFMQVICLCTGVFVLPLEHVPHWKRRYVCLSLTAVLVYGAMSAVIRDFYSIFTGPADFLSGIAASGPLQSIPYLIGVALYYLMPLAASYALLRVCTPLPWQDVLYGTTCSYAVQHISFCASVIVFGGVDVPWAGGWLLAILTAAAGYYLLAGRLPMNGAYRVSTRKALAMAAIIFTIGMLMNIPARWLQESQENAYFYVICMGYDFLSCVFILWSQTEQRREVDLQASIRAEQRLRLQMQEQYDLSRENIDLVNRKCHDLKHQIAALRFVHDPKERDAGLEEIEQAVLIYDSVAKTGNEVLDTVLTEKSLICEQSSISWTCMADGEILSFITPVDLYTLFGNALDNAIEASARIPDPECRHVAVTVRKHHGAAFIQVENYCVKPPQFRDGLPLTTKSDVQNHGFGVGSIREIAQRYGGTMDITLRENPSPEASAPADASRGEPAKADFRRDDGPQGGSLCLFLLTILIPIPQTAVS